MTKAIKESSPASSARPADSSLRILMTRERRVELGRIVLTGIVVFLHWQQWVGQYHHLD
ncbi:MAG: hypothetical protein M3Y08_12100 [Fibrobacterota bacterium]|nr:hypothetical protein [Fibrobacterota bacterium]